MKNKRFKYILLFVVGFIYFKLFVRISSNISEESNLPVAQMDKIYLNEEIFDGLMVKSIKRENIVVHYQKENKIIPLNP